MEVIARFIDELGNKHWRKYFAKHLYEADRKASGIAKSHNWKVVSVGWKS